jgi:hypothetical protein
MKNLPARIEKLESAVDNGCNIKFFFISEDGTIEHKGKIITPEEYAVMTEGTDVINFIDPPRNNPYKES